jgi:molybdopterin-guanine dinucleotide biosynthesis protein A
VWRRSALPAIDAAIDAGTLAVKAALDALDAVEIRGVDPAWLRNVNEPSDLDQTGRRGGRS